MQEENGPPPDMKVKRHGCICPFHPMQVLSYLIFLFYVYVFFFIELVSLQQLGSPIYVLIVPFALLFVAMAAADIVLTLSDPTDPTVYSERAKKDHK